MRELGNAYMLDALFGDLSPPEQQEFLQALDYIQEKMQTGQRIPEGSIAHVIARCSPAVQEKFATIDDLLETPRLAPFEQKRSEGEVADLLMLDPAAAVLAKSQIDLHVVGKSLQNRMGTDEPKKELTPRDVLERAYDMHTETPKQEVKVIPKHLIDQIPDEYCSRAVLTAAVREKEDHHGAYGPEIHSDVEEDPLTNAAEDLSLRDTISTIVECENGRS